ncbi:hypothetical protein [Pseudoduganella violaceinigra]|uniref:hypothetical protein n=1 Tax=Pseudoduganella violaceinigra TaxID=246602 RepID=UPI0003FA3E11|nr:hypothetical protein [Pseudoduganella violaceinigra]
MINTRLNDAASLGLHGLADAGEIHSLAPTLPTPKTRPLLHPAEEALSLPPPALGTDPKLMMLGQAVGPALSFDNPVWRGNPVPALRGLQKMLIDQALNHPLEERGPSLRAVKVVERAVQLRLRWQQMRRSDAEPDRALQAEGGRDEAVQA